jgi:ABC-type nitrate/sulfonate/bicarbonate transport system substrate-binding protein
MKPNSAFLSRILAIGLILTLAVCVGGVPAAQAAKTRARLAVFPLGFMRMTSEWMTDSGTWKKYGDKHNVDFKIMYPRDDFAAFAGRSADIAAFAAFEIARVRSEEGWKAVMFGKDQSGLPEIYVRSDSPYKSITELKGKKFAIPGWATAAALLYQVLLKKNYNIDLKKDFQIVVSSFPLVPQLLARGDVEVGSTIMPLTLSQMVQKKFRVLGGKTYAEEWEDKQKHFGLAVTLWAGWEDYMDKNPNVARAILEAWTVGLVHANTKTGQWIRQYKKFVGKNPSEADFNYFAKWIKDHRPMFKDAYLTPAFVEGENQFVRDAAKLGLVGKTKESEIKKMWRIVKP